MRIVSSFSHLAARLSIDGGDNYCDTGWVDRTLALQVNLPVVDRQRISGITGIREVIHLALVGVGSAAKYHQYGLLAAVDRGVWPATPCPSRKNFSGTVYDDL